MCAWERELGFFTPEFEEKPIAKTFRDFRAFLDALPSAKLPPFRRDAVCVLTREQNFDQTMSNGWSAFLLAKQNGFDVRFQYVNETFEKSDLYIVPGLRGACGIFREEYLGLLERVKEGATLYISLDDGALSPFESIFGVEVESREARTAPARVKFGNETFILPSPFRLNLRKTHAEVLAAEEDGNPVFIRAKYGKGTVCLLTLPLELGPCGPSRRIPQDVGTGMAPLLPRFCTACDCKTPCPHGKSARHVDRTSGRRGAGTLSLRCGQQQRSSDPAGIRNRGRLETGKRASRTRPLLRSAVPLNQKINRPVLPDLHPAGRATKGRQLHETSPEQKKQFMLQT